MDNIDIRQGIMSDMDALDIDRGVRKGHPLGREHHNEYTDYVLGQREHGLEYWTYKEWLVEEGYEPRKGVRK